MLGNLLPVLGLLIVVSLAGEGRNAGRVVLITQSVSLHIFVLSRDSRY